MLKPLLPDAYLTSKGLLLTHGTQGLPSRICASSGRRHKFRPKANEANMSSCSSSCSSDSTNLQEVMVGTWKSSHMALSMAQQIPRSTTGQFQLSLGSRAHPAGCVLCIWHIRARGCFDGLLCRYCHADHDMSYQDRRRSQRQAQGTRDPTATKDSSKGRGKVNGSPEGTNVRMVHGVHQDRPAGTIA